MCPVNNKQRKFISEKLAFVLEQISKSNIKLSDIEKAVGLFEKVTDIIIQIKCPLFSLCSIDSVAQNSNECLLQNHLKRLRASSIDLLSCRKNSPKKTNKLKRTAGKRVAESINDAPEAKRANNGEGSSTLMNVSIGMGRLDICYICKKHNIPRHEFYPWMCFPCGEVNFKKRNQTADLTGKVALVTGGRIKIGFEIALKLLRCGASVIITTRFPNDARRRYELENDFAHFANRLQIFGLDLRFIPQVDKFCEYFLKHFGQLDIFIQNAAQTIRRPTVYYKALIDGERRHTSIVSDSTGSEVPIRFDGQANMQLTLNDNLSSYTGTDTSKLLIHPDDFKYACNSQLSQLHFPLDVKDDNGDQLDLRSKNTWTTTLDEVETQEMVEVTLVNYMSPFILLRKLTPLMAEGRNLW